MRFLIEPAPFAIEIAAGVERKGELVIVDGKPEDADAYVRIDTGAFAFGVRMWMFPTGLPDLSVMYVAETHRLFVGAKVSSFVIDLARGAVEHTFEHTMFWGFDRSTRPGFVLETGELDCLFRALDGRVLDCTSVDPPWESFVEAGGVRFQSCVLGRTFLPFPDALTTS